jgi:hypothetical protein
MLHEMPTNTYLLTEQQLAERWSISVKTLQNRRVSGGFIPYVKISRSVRYRLEDVTRWEIANLRDNTSESERS